MVACRTERHSLDSVEPHHTTQQTVLVRQHVEVVVLAPPPRTTIRSKKNNTGGWGKILFVMMSFVALHEDISRTKMNGITEVSSRRSLPAHTHTHTHTQKHSRCHSPTDRTLRSVSRFALSVLPSVLTKNFCVCDSMSIRHVVKPKEIHTTLTVTHTYTYMHIHMYIHTHTHTHKSYIYRLTLSEEKKKFAALRPPPEPVSALIGYPYVCACMCACVCGSSTFDCRVAQTGTVVLHRHTHILLGGGVRA